jgi:hypothetical protein
VRRDFIDYTCDLNPHKQGHFLPGSHIPIRSPDAIREDKPDVVLILPWNLKDEIITAAELHPRVGRALRGAHAGADAAPVIAPSAQWAVGSAVAGAVGICTGGADAVRADAAARGVGHRARQIDDERGWFARTFDAEEFAAHGLNPAVAQCNVSLNLRRDTLR